MFESAGESLAETYSYMKTLPVVKEVLKGIEDSGFQLPTFQINHCAFFSQGFLLFITLEAYPEAHDIFKRFAKVFEQTYTRFLDLQKAEAQAREAQIEASLERVRARTMAMHSSEEVGSAITTLFTELDRLGIENMRCGIAIFNKNQTMDVWSVTNVDNGKTVRAVGQLDVNAHKLWQLLYHAWENKSHFFHYYLSAKEKQDYLAVLNNAPNYLSQPLLEMPDMHFQTYNFNEGGIWTFSIQPHTEQHIQVMKRFTSVFSLTFRRYQDLKKAEVQAREAQIEAALERVRSRSLAMHTTNELGEVVKVIVEKLQDLGVVLDANGVVLCTYFPNSKNVLHWIVSPDYSMTGSYLLPYFDHPIFNAAWHSKESGDEYFSEAFSVEEKNSFFEYAFEHSDYKHFPEDFKQWIFQNDKHILSFAWQKNSAILIPSHTGVVPNDAEKAILVRFARVFEQAYVRFMDLQKAEAQAREATIEAAFEKVRGKAMAMHNSNDLSVTTSMIITELRRLGITPIRCGVGLINKETHQGQLYTAISSADGDSLSVVGWVLLKGHPVLENIYEKWSHGEDYFPELSGDSRRAYYEQLLGGLSIPVPDFKDEQIHYGHFFSFSVGCLYAWSEVKYNDDEIKILKRFASIIDLTFRRYIELQKSEANAREAVRQASLDRVRAEIASMRTTNDLERITPLIWNELTILGVPFIRCGVFIMDDSQQLIHTFLSTPDGKAIAAFHLPYNTPGNIAQVLRHWQDKKNYIDHWDESAFTEFAEILVKQGASCFSRSNT